jgi:molybdopterin synthase catalytic subunit
MSFDFNAAMAEIQSHPRILDAGMVLLHYGLVRSFNLQGQTVISLEVRPDTAKAESIRRELLQRPGMVEIVVRLNSGVLQPGDPIMLVAVAGETRDHVFPVMEELIERLKKEASVKTEKTT